MGGRDSAPALDPPKPEDVKRRLQAYERERVKRRPDLYVMGANEVVDDAWMLRYENPDGRVQAAHNAWVEAMWSRTEGNEGVDTLADQVYRLAGSFTRTALEHLRGS